MAASYGFKLDLFQVTANFLGLAAAFRKTDGTLMMALVNPVGEQSGGFIVECVLRKRFPRGRFQVVSHHETGKFVVSCDWVTYVEQLHAKFFKWGKERVSIWRVYLFARLDSEPLDQDVELEQI